MQELIGALFAITAALGFALWNIFMQRGLQKGASPRLALLTLAGATGGIFLPVALVEWWLGGFPTPGWGGVGYFVLAGVLTAGIAPFHATLATQRIGAAKTTSIRLLDPLFALLIGLVFLHESVAIPAMVGIGLIMLALWLLQSDRVAETGAAGRRAGVLLAVGASLYFTVGSILRKAGLNTVPMPALATAVEGLTGLLIALPAFGIGGRWSELREAFRVKHRDLWISGTCSALAAFCLVMALQRLPVPAAVALRNTSPWYALFLVPILLGSQHRPSKWMWGSTLLLTAGMVLILWR